MNPLLPLFPRGTKTRGWPKHDVGGHVDYYPLSVLLTTEYPGDAHFSAYSAPSVKRRLVTDPPAYERIEGGVPMTVLLFDDDCAAAHRAMGGSEKLRADNAWWNVERAKFELLIAAYPGAFIYRTRGGARIVYSAEPYVIRTGPDESGWKRHYLSHVAMLARRFNIVCDPAISDWPRLHRLPHVVRDGVPQRLDTIGDPRRVGSLRYVPNDLERAADLRKAREIAARAPGPWRPAVALLANRVELRTERAKRPVKKVEPRELDAGEFQALAEDLGKALRKFSGRHAIHMAIAGACYSRGVPVERGPELARAIMSVTGETDDRPQPWQTTGERVRSGRPVAGYSKLKANWPELADIIDAALPHDGGARAVRDSLDAIGVPPSFSAADAAGQIRDAISSAPMGLTVIRVTEGAGKTQAATDVAIARANTAGSGRVPSTSRTLIVTDKHSVAIRVFERLADAGVRAEYRRSVLAVKKPDGSPACEYFVPVSALARGGQSPVAVFCEGVGMGDRGGNQPCPRKDDCPAYLGSTISLNPDQGGPAVVVTVHAKLAEGLAWVGEAGLVILDEDPHAVTAHTFRREDLERAIRASGALANFEQWRTVVLRALAAGLEIGSSGNTVADLFRAGCQSLESTDDWREDAERYYATTDPGAIANSFAQRAAYRRIAEKWQRRPSWAPKPHRREHVRVFSSRSASAELVESSRVHAVIAQAFAGGLKIIPPGANEHREHASMVVEMDEHALVLRVLIASAAVTEATKRTGPTVLLDATANTDLLSEFAGYEVKTVDIRVGDGAPMHRRILYYSAATRSKCLTKNDNTVQWDGLKRYVREALGFVLGRGVMIAMFTWLPLANVLRDAWAGSSNADPVAVELLAPVRAQGGDVRIGHYGATRGSDEWMDADAFVTIGDPRPNLGSVHAIASAIGLGDERDAVYRHATAAELSQAAGRARAPWRTKNCIHVHVGTVAPLSWDARAEVVELPRSAVSLPGVSAAVRVYGSKRQAARAGAISETSFRRAAGRDSEGLAARHLMPTEDTGGVLSGTKRPAANVLEENDNLLVRANDVSMMSDDVVKQTTSEDDDAAE